MPWFVILIIVWLVVRSMRRSGHAHAHFHGCAGGARARHMKQRTQLHAPLPVREDTRAPRERSRAERPLTRFEQLQKRYVNDELTVEQYEREVDTLLRAPGGMREI